MRTGEKRKKEEGGEREGRGGRRKKQKRQRISTLGLSWGHKIRTSLAHSPTGHR